MHQSASEFRVRNLGFWETISIYDIVGKIRQCMKRQDGESAGEHRQVAMVCHQFRQEWKTITSLRISTENGLNHVLAILDTSQIVSDISYRPRGQPMGLQDLAVELGIPFGREDFQTVHYEHYSYWESNNKKRIIVRGPKLDLWTCYESLDKVRSSLPWLT